MHSTLGLNVGDKLEVYWPLDNKYYPGIVLQRFLSLISLPRYHILYDDGDTETLVLSNEVWRHLPQNENILLSQPSRSASTQNIPTVTQVRTPKLELRNQNHRKPSNKTPNQVASGTLRFPTSYTPRSVKLGQSKVMNDSDIFTKFLNDAMITKANQEDWKDFKMETNKKSMADRSNGNLTRFKSKHDKPFLFLDNGWKAKLMKKACFQSKDSETMEVNQLSKLCSDSVDLNHNTRSNVLPTHFKNVRRADPRNKQAVVNFSTASRKGRIMQDDKTCQRRRKRQRISVTDAVVPYSCYEELSGKKSSDKGNVGIASNTHVIEDNGGPRASRQTDPDMPDLNLKNMSCNNLFNNLQSTKDNSTSCQLENGDKLNDRLSGKIMRQKADFNQVYSLTSESSEREATSLEDYSTLHHISKPGYRDIEETICRNLISGDNIQEGQNGKERMTPFDIKPPNLLLLPLKKRWNTCRSSMLENDEGGREFESPISMRFSRVLLKNVSVNWKLSQSYAGRSLGNDRSGQGKAFNISKGYSLQDYSQKIKTLTISCRKKRETFMCKECSVE